MKNKTTDLHFFSGRGSLRSSLTHRNGVFHWKKVKSESRNSRLSHLKKSWNLAEIK